MVTIERLTRNDRNAERSTANCSISSGKSSGSRLSTSCDVKFTRGEALPCLRLECTLKAGLMMDVSLG